MAQAPPARACWSMCAPNAGRRAGGNGVGASYSDGERVMSTPLVPVEQLPPIGPVAPLLRLDGMGHALRVWLGGAGDHGALEADLREVAARGVATLPALAVALGSVAARHKLEVRVIPRLDDDGPSVLVIFGARVSRPK